MGESGGGGRAGGAGRGQRGREGAAYNLSRRELLEALVDPNLSRIERDLVIEAFDRVPTEDLAELAGITTEPPFGYEDTGRNWYSETWDSTAAGTYGQYDADFGGPVIRIHPAYIADAVQYGVISSGLERIAAHEAGHHWHLYLKGAGRTATGGRLMTGRGDAFTRNIADHVMPDLKKLSSGNLARMGLRKYSTTNAKEFMADAYKTMRLGGGRSTSRQQLERLSAYVTRRFNNRGVPVGENLLEYLGVEY